MITMRAKMYVAKIELHGTSEILHLSCVGRKDAYPSDGSDENNTFAKFSPSGSLTLQVTNPSLWGKLKPGDAYYLDFTRAEK